MTFDPKLALRFWEHHPNPITQDIRPPLHVEATLSEHQERGRRRGTETTRQKGQLTSEQRAAVAEYFKRHPDASISRAAKDLAPEFKRKPRTVRNKIKLAKA